MIKTTTWRPDTCECEIEFEWDDSVPAASRVHTGKKINKACAAHQGVALPSNHFNLVQDENSRKNIALKIAMDNIPALRKQIATADGGLADVLADGVNFTYSFDGSRNLEISFSGVKSLSASEKSSLKTLLDTRFGTGKVKVL